MKTVTVPIKTDSTVTSEVFLKSDFSLSQSKSLWNCPWREWNVCVWLLITNTQAPLVSLLPAAKQSAHRRWACTPAARAWYVGVSGGLGWCPRKTSGRSASWASLPSAPPIRWDRQRPCRPPRPQPVEGPYRCPSFCSHPHGPPPLPRLLASLYRETF